MFWVCKFLANDFFSFILVKVEQDFDSSRCWCRIQISCRLTKVSLLKLFFRLKSLKWANADGLTSTAHNRSTRHAEARAPRPGSSQWGRVSPLTGSDSTAELNAAHSSHLTQKLFWCPNEANFCPRQLSYGFNFFWVCTDTENLQSGRFSLAKKRSKTEVGIEPTTLLVSWVHHTPNCLTISILWCYFKMT